MWFQKLTNSEKKVRNSVVPAEAGIQDYVKILYPRLLGNDTKGSIKTFYETIKPGSLDQDILTTARQYHRDFSTIALRLGGSYFFPQCLAHL
jgi:hypothetical protein